MIDGKDWQAWAAERMAEGPLTDAQRTLIGMEIEPDVRKEVWTRRSERIAEAQAGGAKIQGADNKRGVVKSHRTDHIVGQAVGMDESLYRRSKHSIKLAMEHRPAILEEVRAGRMTLRDVRQASGENTRYQREKTKQATLDRQPPRPRPPIMRLLDDIHALRGRVAALRLSHGDPAMGEGIEGRELVAALTALADELSDQAKALRRSSRPALTLVKNKGEERGRTTTA